MAQTTYVSKAAITTLPGLRTACDRISDLWGHMFTYFVKYNVRFVSSRVLPDNRIEFVVSNPIPADQIDNLGVEVAQ